MIHWHCSYNYSTRSRPHDHNTTAVFENRKRGKRRRVVYTPRNPSSENYRVTNNNNILITMRFSFTNGGGYGDNMPI